MNYMYWIEKYNLNFQIHIKNSDDSKIYKQKNLDEVIGTLNQVEDVILDVVATSEINKNYYFKTTHRNELVGWLKPTKESIKYFNTKKNEVKLYSNFQADNELNQLLDIDINRLKENSIKIFFSDSYAIYNDNIYCSILLKDELLGFVKIDQISFYNNINEEFKFNKEKITLFKDSKMEKPIIEDFEPKNEIYKSLGKFNNFDGVRVIIDGKRYWADIKDTDLEPHIETIQDTEDVIIDTIFNQLLDKVEFQNKFYKQKMQQLNEKITVLQEREKENNLKRKQLRELLSSK